MFSHDKTPTGKHPRPQQTWPLATIYECKRKNYREVYKRVSNNSSLKN